MAQHRGEADEELEEEADAVAAAVGEEVVAVVLAPEVVATHDFYQHVGESSPDHSLYLGLSCINVMTCMCIDCGKSQEEMRGRMYM